MVGKRGPTTDLNHNNWNEEEEPEEAGHFKEADENELKTRVIKKARRRIGDPTNAGDNTPKSIFGDFAGFGKTAAAPAENTNKASSLFSFLSKIPTAAPAATATESTPVATTVPATLTKTTPTTTNTNNASEEAYHAKVIKLNQTFCNWIKKHVEEEPLCNLLSTFKDYEKYWEQLSAENLTATKGQGTSSTSITKPVVPAVSSTTTNATPSIFTNIKFNSPTSTGFGFGASTSAATTTPSKVDNKNLFSFGNNKPPNGNETTISPFKTSTNGSKSEMGKLATDDPAMVKSSFSFGLKPADKPTNATATTSPSAFSFGLKKDTPAASGTAPTATVSTPFSFGPKTNATDKPLSTAGFSFGASSVPFSFGNIKPPASIDANNDNKDSEDKDDEDEPPKVEVKEIVEEDAFYTKKCKVFLKKDNAYKDFGLAMLYLKPVQGSSKTQLLVRSSPLGKILINMLLAEATPVQRVGKNNVMIIYPNADGENQTNLIRVKDATEADDLLETINKHKK